MPPLKTTVLALVLLCLQGAIVSCAVSPPTSVPAPPVMPTVTAVVEQAGGSKTAQRERATHVVAIDPGHGGPDDSIVHKDSEGRRYREGERTGIGVYQPDGSVLWEKDLTLDVAQRLKRRLDELGYTAVLTRNGDRAVNDPPRDVNGDGEIDTADELQARADAVNGSGAELFISVHFNGYPTTNWRGTATFYCADRPFAAENLNFANQVHDRVWDALEGLGYKPLDRGVMDDQEAAGRGHLLLLGPGSKGGPRPTRMPGVLVEPLFLTNRDEEALIERAETREALARALAQAVGDYLDPRGPAPAQATQGPR